MTGAVGVILAIAAAVGYALQGALMARHYRRMDVTQATAMRGLALGISMLPLLGWVSWSRIDPGRDSWVHLLIAVAATMGANLLVGLSVRYFVVGVASALLNGSQIIASLILGFALLGERPSRAEGLCAVVLVLACCALAAQRQTERGLGRRHPRRGLAIVGLFGVLIALGTIGVASFSRTVDPLLAAYLWEFLIGVAALGLSLVRFMTAKKPLADLNAANFKAVFLSSLPTAAATPCFALALQYGSVGVTAAVLSTALVFTAAFGYLFYREVIGPKQLGLMAVILVAIMVLNLLPG